MQHYYLTRRSRPWNSHIFAEEKEDSKCRKKKIPAVKMSHLLTNNKHNNDKISYNKHGNNLAIQNCLILLGIKRGFFWWLCPTYIYVFFVPLVFCPFGMFSPTLQSEKDANIKQSRKNAEIRTLYWKQAAIKKIEDISSFELKNLKRAKSFDIKCLKWTLNLKKAYNAFKLWDSTMGDLDIGIQEKKHSQTGFNSYKLPIHNWTNFMKVYEIITFQVRESYGDKWVADVIKS